MVMTRKKEGPKKSESKPVETAMPAPAVEGTNVAGEFEKFRSRTKNDKVKAKADEVHEILMGVKPGITVKPSKGWLSYLSGKTRFAALEVRENHVKVHSLKFSDKKMTCEIINITASDKTPVAKIKKRAGAYITAKTKKD